MREYDVQAVIIGGGATGAGILRDLSLRGISALLLEQGDLAHGTSSRFHGLLHSGGRYAVKDPAAAAECAAENRILKRIAPACISPAGGWFVLLERDDPGYEEKWLKGCQAAGIPVREIPVAEALRQEPLLSSRIKKVYEVPDGAVDGFKLVWANARAAARCGGKYLTYSRVREVLRAGNKVTGVSGEDLLRGEPFVVHSEMVINASGAWASRVAQTAGVKLEVICDKGTLLAYNQRLVGHIVNRLRVPGDGDIFVPHESITILGTTAQTVEGPEDNVPLRGEVELLSAAGQALIPALPRLRVIRAFAGVRPLHREDRELRKGEEGRGVSRNFALIDHGAEGVDGFLSIVGGKFTTYRLMAERVADWAAQRLGNTVPCRTAVEPLEAPLSAKLLQTAGRVLPDGGCRRMLERLGEEAEEVLAQIEENPRLGQILCECEMVTLAEVQKIIKDPDTHHLADVRRKTRLGMGTCQGAFCTYRALPLLFGESGRFNVQRELEGFLDQRWKGIRPVLAGDQARETELTRAIYAGLLGKCGEEMPWTE